MSEFIKLTRIEGMPVIVRVSIIDGFDVGPDYRDISETEEKPCAAVLLENGKMIYVCEPLEEIWKMLNPMQEAQQ